jgi:hypothetical protein
MMLFRPAIIKAGHGESKKLPTKIVQAVFCFVIVNTYYTKIDTRSKEKTMKLAFMAEYKTTLSKLLFYRTVTHFRKFKKLAANNH